MTCRRQTFVRGCRLVFTGPRLWSGHPEAIQIAEHNRLKKYPTIRLRTGSSIKPRSRSARQACVVAIPLRDSVFNSWMVRKQEVIRLLPHCSSARVAVGKLLISEGCEVCSGD